MSLAMGGGTPPQRHPDLSTIACEHRRRWHAARSHLLKRMLLLIFLLVGTAVVVVSLVWGHRAQVAHVSTIVPPQDVQP